MRDIKKQFCLNVFGSGSCWEGVTVFGYIHRKPGVITVEYRLCGDLENIDLPSQISVVQRCDELWKQTCFELFIAVQGSSRYWECNFSPDGNWNVYRFSDYRLGMVEEEKVYPLDCSVIRGNDMFSLTVSLAVEGVIADQSELDIGVSSVVIIHPDILGYWAVSHPEPKADFHNRKSFGIKIPSILNEQSE